MDELDDHFLNEFKELRIYKVLSDDTLYSDEALRRELNERYLSDYVNMIHDSNTETEMQVCIIHCMILPDPRARCTLIFRWVIKSASCLVQLGISMCDISLQMF